MRVDVWGENISRSLVRLTRGFLYLFRPELAANLLDFNIVQIDQFRTFSIVLSGVTSVFAHYARGDGVYEHWRGLAADNPYGGLWVHVFYGASMWLVRHDRGDGRITIEGARGFEMRLQ